MSKKNVKLQHLQLVQSHEYKQLYCISIRYKRLELVLSLRWCGWHSSKVPIGAMFPMEHSLCNWGPDELLLPCFLSLCHCVYELFAEVLHFMKWMHTLLPHLVYFSLCCRKVLSFRSSRQSPPSWFAWWVDHRSSSGNWFKHHPTTSQMRLRGFPMCQLDWGNR